jgi:hypothetical protein
MYEVIIIKAIKIILVCNKKHKSRVLELLKPDKNTIEERIEMAENIYDCRQVKPTVI